jgi:hypothetical protein
MELDLERFVSDFLQVSRLAGKPLARADIEVEVLPRPHRRPSQLPERRQAVYVFATDSHCLKVGKVGPNSQPRFVSQHYIAKPKGSCLANSLLAGAAAPDGLRQALGLLTPENVGAWIETDTTRVRLYLREEQPKVLLALLEAFARCRFDPVFEGGDRRA